MEGAERRATGTAPLLGIFQHVYEALLDETAVEFTLGMESMAKEWQTHEDEIVKWITRLVVRQVRNASSLLDHGRAGVRLKKLKNWRRMSEL